jgi:hypothetical protein
MKNYKHDCNQCVYLGEDSTEDKNVVDMYFCYQEGIPTIIARNSDEPSDYSSYPIVVINENIDMFAPTPFLRNMLIAEDMKLFNRQTHLKGNNENQRN